MVWFLLHILVPSLPSVVLSPRRFSAELPLLLVVPLSTKTAGADPGRWPKYYLTLSKIRRLSSPFKFAHCDPLSVYSFSRFLIFVLHYCQSLSYPFSHIFVAILLKITWFLTAPAHVILPHPPSRCCWEPWPHVVTASCFNPLPLTSVSCLHARISCLIQIQFGFNPHPEVGQFPMRI